LDNGDLDDRRWKDREMHCADRLDITGSRYCPMAGMINFLQPVTGNGYRRNTQDFISFDIIYGETLIA
jgi:hypothetical protein